MILNLFYTDKIQVYRAEEDIKTDPYGGATKLTRQSIGKPFYGRVRDKSNGALEKTDTVARAHKACSLVCGLEADVKEGDVLLVIRGAKSGGSTEERYLVGVGQEFREPFGGVSPQIYHKRFFITKEEYVHETGSEVDDLADDIW